MAGKMKKARLYTRRNMHWVFNNFINLALPSIVRNLGGEDECMCVHKNSRKNYHCLPGSSMYLVDLFSLNPIFFSFWNRSNKRLVSSSHYRGHNPCNS